MLLKIDNVENGTRAEIFNETSNVYSRRIQIDFAENSLALWLAIAFVVYLIFFLFIGIIKLLEHLMTAVELIISKRTIFKWNKTVANFSLIAFSLNAFEFLYPTIELVTTGFKSCSTGPYLIMGTCAFNLLILTSLSIFLTPVDTILYINKILIFLNSFVFLLLCYVWIFVILFVISPFQIEIWEAALLVVLYATLILTSFVIDQKNLGQQNETFPTVNYETCEISQINEKQIKEKMMLLDKLKIFNSQQKLKILNYYFSKHKIHSPLHYKILSIAQLTGNKNDSFSIHRDMKKLLDNLESKFASPANVHEINYLFDNSSSINKPMLCSILQFSSSSYAIKTKKDTCDVVIDRTGGCLDTEIEINLNSIDGSMISSVDYKKMKNHSVKLERYENKKRVKITINPQLTSEVGNHFFLSLDIHKDSFGLADYGANRQCSITVMKKSKLDVVEFDQLVYRVNNNEKTVTVKLQRPKIKFEEILVSLVVFAKTFEASSRRIYVKLLPNEVEKSVTIPIILRHSRFYVELISTSDDIVIGHKRRVLVLADINKTMSKKYESEIQKLLRSKQFPHSSKKPSWPDQFKNAANVNNSDIENASLANHVAHCLSFFWKVLFSVIPPAELLSGWPCFFVSICFLIILIIFAIKLISILSFLIEFNEKVIVFNILPVLLGIPKILASYLSMTNEITADNTLNFIPIANSIITSCGLGVPWLISACVLELKNGRPFNIQDAYLFYFPLLYLITANVACLGLLMLRRKFKIFGAAELGGSEKSKFFSFLFLFSLWIGFIIFNLN